MAEINPYYNNLAPNYLFSQIAQKVTQYTQKTGNAPINLGIGDAVLPLVPAVTEAFSQAVLEMGKHETFRGYGPEQGYPFLREAIAHHEYQAHNIDIDSQEIFVSDGSKCDTANIQELFAPTSTVAIPNPVYPVYLDSNIMAGRSIHYLNGTEENGFIPNPPTQPYDLVYLCFPNNPTGTMATADLLHKWVTYALTHHSIIIYDAAYERFIHGNLPHSIYQIPEARKVAIEMRSFSKSAGFTGTRCAFTVVPKECRAYHNTKEVALHPLWLRRCTTKFNGVSYPVQRAAAATYTKEGRAQITQTINYYMHNAAIIREVLDAHTMQYWGGVHAPYVWVRAGTNSWELFDTLLTHSLVTTPGVGFGSCGEGYIRISAFNRHSEIEKAAQILQKTLPNL